MPDDRQKADAMMLFIFAVAIRKIGKKSHSLITVTCVALNKLGIQANRNPEELINDAIQRVAPLSNYVFSGSQAKTPVTKCRDRLKAKGYLENTRGSYGTDEYRVTETGTENLEAIRAALLRELGENEFETLLKSITEAIDQEFPALRCTKTSRRNPYR